MKISLTYRTNASLDKEIREQAALGIDRFGIENAPKAAQSTEYGEKLAYVLITDSVDAASMAAAHKTHNVIILVSTAAETVVPSILVAAPQEVAKTVCEGLSKL